MSLYIRGLSIHGFWYLISHGYQGRIIIHSCHSKKYLKLIQYKSIRLSPWPHPARFPVLHQPLPTPSPSTPQTKHHLSVLSQCFLQIHTDIKISVYLLPPDPAGSLFYRALCTSESFKLPGELSTQGLWQESSPDRLDDEYSMVLNKVRPKHFKGLKAKECMLSNSSNFNIYKQNSPKPRSLPSCCDGYNSKSQAVSRNLNHPLPRNQL